jgi:hypothetical protein
MRDGDPSTEDGPVVVIVRSGGLAGMRRQWRAEPPADDAARWVELIDRCPWDEASAPTRGADRYIWTIRARMAGRERERDVPDGELSGPWRELVDAVRAMRRGRR